MTDLANVGEFVNKSKKTVAEDFEMTYFLSKLYGIILALDIIGFNGECDLEVGNIIL